MTVQDNKSTNWLLWASTIAIPLLAIVVAIIFPEIRCFFGLPAEICEIKRKDVFFYTFTEAGDPLPKVKIQVSGTGAPEEQYSDDHGFVKFNIATNGEIRVILSKEGYPTQNYVTNNIYNHVYLTQSGKPTASSSDKPIPTVTANKPKESIVSPTNKPNQEQGSEITSISMPFENDIIKATTIGSSFSQANQYAQVAFEIENISDKNLLLAYENGTVTAITNNGQKSPCTLDGLKYVNSLNGIHEDSYYSNLYPKAKVNITISGCSQITPKTKAESVSVNVSFVKLEDSKPKQFTLSLNHIPLPK